MGNVTSASWIRLAALAAGVGLVVAACSGGDGDGGGGGSGTSAAASSSTAVTTPSTQEQFHPEFLESLRLTFDTLIPERFAPDPKSVKVVDATQGEIVFKTQKELGALAMEQGLLGFGVADFTASRGFEYWGLVTWVFRTPAGARAVFERFPDPERVTVSDATQIDSRTEPYGEGRLGNVSTETYSSPDGVTTLFLRGSLVDGNALHYVSAVVDVPIGTPADGMSQIRQVVRSLDGLYPAIFGKFLELGGTDEAPTTTTRNPTYVPGEEIPGEG